MNQKELLICLFILLTDGLNAQDIVFSHQPGFYTEAIELEIHSLSNDPLYYTLDGSIPVPGSEGCYLYRTPIELRNRSSEANGISMIPTAPADIYYKWAAPEENIFKANVIRVMSFPLDKPSGRTHTASYFISEDIIGKYSMPLISITTNNENLFDFDSGIYVPGVHLDPNKGIKETGNYFMKGRDWERAAHIEFFSIGGELEFSQDFGIRIHGGNSRLAPQKSLRAYARSEYGKSRLEYRLFPELEIESYKRFVLQMCDLRSKRAIFIDDIVRDLSKDITDGMASRPCITFINGEYWGIYRLRERIDEYYVSSHHNVDDDEIDLLESSLMRAVEGSNTDYSDLINYIKQNELSDSASYSYVKDKVDIDQLIDYLSTEIYFANYDWPMGNIKYWREQSNTSKWRWLLYDLDQGFVNPEYNMFEHASLDGRKTWPNPDHSTFLFRSLLKNQDFEDLFLSRILYLANHYFETGIVLDKISEYQSLFEPEIDGHFRRWTTAGDRELWIKDLNQVKVFARSRPYYFKSQLIDFFDNDSLRVSELSDQPSFISFPNPTRDQVSIEFREANKHYYNYSVFDLYGRLAISGKLELKKKVYTLDLSSLPGGSYILLVQSDKKILSRKILKTDR